MECVQHTPTRKWNWSTLVPIPPIGRVLNVRRSMSTFGQWRYRFTQWGVCETYAKGLANVINIGTASPNKEFVKLTTKREQIWLRMGPLYQIRCTYAWVSLAIIVLLNGVCSTYTKTWVNFGDTGTVFTNRECVKRAAKHEYIWFKLIGNMLNVHQRMSNFG